MKFQHAALVIAVAAATLPVIADRVGYVSSVRIPQVERSDAEESRVMAGAARITLDRAKAIAIKAAPGSHMIEAELENEDGNVVYEVEFLDKGRERTIVIDAGNGRILADKQDRN